MEPDAPGESSPHHLSGRPAAEGPAQLSTSLVSLIIRPEIGLWTVFFIIIGEVAAFYFAPTEWSVMRRVAAGILFGIGSTFCLLLPRMIGGADYN